MLNVVLIHPIHNYFLNSGQWAWNCRCSSFSFFDRWNKLNLPDESRWHILALWQEQMAQIKNTMTADRDAAMAAMQSKLEAQFQEHQKRLEKVQQVRALMTLVPGSLKLRNVFRNEM